MVLKQQGIEDVSMLHVTLQTGVNGAIVGDYIDEHIWCLSGYDDQKDGII